MALTSGQNVKVSLEDRVALVTKKATVRVGLMNLKEGDAHATSSAKEAERARIRSEIAQWLVDIETAWQTYRDR